MTAVDRVALKRLKSQIMDLGQDREYLNSRLIKAYTEINRLTDEVNEVSLVNSNCLQFVTQLINVIHNNGAISPELLIAMLSEHGILDD
jgi:hypothetical protein